jgi:predicted nucleotidyltransferase
MRLTAHQIEIIQTTAQSVVGDGAKIWLYGSRLDDQRRGGDVDLLIESPRKSGLMARARFKYMAENALQLPVDILLVQSGQTPSPFETIARTQAVELTGLRLHPT